MAMAFSHHSSNPLEATPSDPLNRRYNQIYTGAEFPSSDDPLAKWDTDQEQYANHIKQVVGRDPMEVSPKARFAVFTTPTRKMVDLDEGSDDPLATPFQEGQTTIDPRKLSIPEADEPELAFMDEEEDHVQYLHEERDDQELEYAKDDEVAYGDQGFGDGDADELDGIKHEEYDDQDNLEDYQERFSDGDEDMFEPESPRTSRSSSPWSSPQSSRPPSPDEAKTILTRAKDEQIEIVHEIDSLYDSVPELKGDYKLVDRLGTGTFSSVYKAIDLRYDDWDNRPWLGHHPPESSAHYQSAGPGFKSRGGRPARTESKDNRVYVAIKRIYTTSGPERIRNEIDILMTCRGCRHSSQIITAFRNLDQVVIVLPYQRNLDFREFYLQLHPEGVKCYFRCLFRALRDIHAQGIIHRDVKPANFLYDPFTGIGTLCDFGLASRMENASTTGQCLHTAATDKEPHGKNVTLTEKLTDGVKKAQKLARLKCALPAEKVGYPENDRRPVSKANRAGTRGFRAPEVLLKCGAQTGAIDVWAAGIIFLFFLTGKFPIFQSSDDIEGLMEIAVILGKKRIERAATLHGRTIITNIPDLDDTGLTWTQFVEKMDPDLYTPRKYDMRFYPHNAKHRDGRASTTDASIQPPTSSSPPTASEAILIDVDGPSTSASVSIHNTSAHDAHSADRHANPMSQERHTKELRHALNFLEGVLHFESVKRTTPRSALYHPYLAEAGLPDDAFKPNRVCEGVCKDLHSRDGVTGQMFVKVLRKCLCMTEEEEDGGCTRDGEDADAMKEDADDGGTEWCGRLVEDHIPLAAGQGITIGDMPCEFHRGSLYGYE